jgi:hypothetical protein
MTESQIKQIAETGTTDMLKIVSVPRKFVKDEYFK